jgi:hypothetical protein
MKSQKNHNWDFAILAFLTALAIIVAAFMSSTMLLPVDRHNDSLIQGLKALGVFGISLLCVIGLWIVFGKRDQNNSYDRHGKRDS